MKALFYYIENNPNACKSEVKRIRIMQMGAIYLITITNNFLRLNFPLNSTSSIIACGLIIKPIKKQVKSATMGIIILLEIKMVHYLISL